MKRAAIVLLTIIPLFFTGISHSYAQQKAATGSEYNFILGEWVGENNGKPGQGFGSFTFKRDLDGNILIRKNHTVFPAANGKPEIIHDDWLIVYLDNAGAMTKAIYFDNESHVINYSVTFGQAERSVVMTSDIQRDMPRFRLTFKYIDDNTMNVDFEMTKPNQPEAFFKYVSGKVLRKGTV